MPVTIPSTTPTFLLECLKGHASAAREALKSEFKISADASDYSLASSEAAGSSRITELDQQFLANTGESALSVCCKNGFSECARILIAIGFDVNSRSKNGMTPLLYASYCCDAATISAIFESRFSNADASVATSGTKNTALHLACSNGLGGLKEEVCAEIAEELLLNNVDPYVFNSSGELPIHCAAASGKTGSIWKSVLGDLVVAGASRGKSMKEMVNAVTTEDTKESALHVAARQNQGDMISVLLALGAEREKQIEVDEEYDQETKGMKSLTPLLIAIVKTGDSWANKSAVGELLDNNVKVELTPRLKENFKSVKEFALALGKPRIAEMLQGKE